VLACYNEAPVLLQSFAEIRETLQSLHAPWEVLFVDDTSRDGTREMLSDLLARHADGSVRTIFHERNLGRGATVSDGFREARGEFVGYLDLDLEVHCRYIPALLGALQKGADVATIRRIYAFQPASLDRYLMSRGYSFLVRKLLGTRLHDTETGYKFFRRESLLPLLEQIRDPGWFWDTEIMIRAERRGLRIVEIPGAYVRRYDKISSVSGVRDSIAYLGRLLRFRRELRRESP
jgi:glycosyltransferase involved in cell wall biosynthesis